jgi:hypothetical protein
MNATHSHRIRSVSRHVVLGLTLAVGACWSSPAPTSNPEPAAPVDASVRQMSYTVNVAAVDADADLGDVGEMVRQALIEGGYALASSGSEADVVLEVSVVATRNAGVMVVVVNGEERVERDIKLTLRAHPAGEERVIDQTTRAFKTKEPRIPAAEVAGAVNAVGAGGALKAYAAERIANAEAAAKAKEQADAKAAADAAAAEELAAKTRGCDQLSDSSTESYVQSFRAEQEVPLRTMASIYGAADRWCQVEETTKNLAQMKKALAVAPSPKRGDASARLTEMAKKSLVRAAVEGVTFIKAGATDSKKNLVNEFGLSMGTTRRIAIVVSVGEGAACFEVRGDWRVSTLHEDRDEPEYVTLDWAGDGPSAYLVACPRR